MQEELGNSLHPSTHPLFCLSLLFLQHLTAAATQGSELVFALVPQQGTK